MKKSICGLLFVAAVLAGGWWLASQRADAQTEKAEPVVPLTKSQFEKLVAQRIAEALAKEKQDKAALDKTILQADSWHTAIFENIEYVVYTGPGTVVKATKVPSGGAKVRGGGATTSPPPLKPSTPLDQ